MCLSVSEREECAGSFLFYPCWKARWTQNTKGSFSLKYEQCPFEHIYLDAGERNSSWALTLGWNTLQHSNVCNQEERLHLFPVRHPPSAHCTPVTPHCFPVDEIPTETQLRTGDFSAVIVLVLERWCGACLVKCLAHYVILFRSQTVPW